MAEAEKLETTQLEKWENGDGTPTLAKLRVLAKRYKRPLMMFYLESPPQGFTPVKDFRLLDPTEPAEFSPELEFAIRSAQEAQAWAEEALADAGEPLSDLVGSVNLSQSAIEVARLLREKLGVQTLEVSELKSPSKAFGYWRELVENQGIFVFQTQKVSVEEMRGFALANRQAPAVVVNSADGYHAKIFTLIHEVAHLLLGESAVTGAGSFMFDVAAAVYSEKFCNQVAAEVLVPSLEFKRLLDSNWLAQPDMTIKSLARAFNVSQSVIVVRLVELGFADRSFLAERMMLFRGSPREGGGGGLPQHELTISRFGRSFTQLAVAQYDSGRIHGGQLSSLLRLKLKHLSALEETLSSNQATEAAAGT